MCKANISDLLEVLLSEIELYLTNDGCPEIASGMLSVVESISNKYSLHFIRPKTTKIFMTIIDKKLLTRGEIHD